MLPQLHLVGVEGSFPRWTLTSKNGMLLLRLLFRKTCVLHMYQGLDAALITGVSFIPTQEPTHVMLSTTLPTAHVMTDAAHFSEYKRAHKMEAAIRQSSAANDGLYGFQAVQGQLIVPFTTAPCIFKSAPCTRAAISIPLDCFVQSEARSHWSSCGDQLKAELERLPPHKQAAHAVSWLWLESCIKAGSSHKR